MPWTDDELLIIIREFEALLKQWARTYFQCEDLNFKTFEQHFDAKPYYNPVVTVLPIMDQWGESIAGYQYNDASKEFSRIINDSPFIGEIDAVEYVFHAKDDALADAYRRYFQFRWICSIIKPDYASVSRELFTYLSNNPAFLESLDWRQFEYLLDAIFRNHGYRTELGPGSGDGGVDLRLYQHDVIGEIVTLVQAKRYRSDLAVKLEAVAALQAIVDDEHANRGLFVTTSRFLPGAQKFAASKSKKLLLATTPDVVRWCDDIAERLRNFDLPKSDAHVLMSLTNPDYQQFVGKIVHAQFGHIFVINNFGIIVKEAPNAVLIRQLESKVVEGCVGGRGWEVPHEQNLKTDEEAIFAKKSSTLSNNTSFWDGRRLWSVWDGDRKYFDWYD